MTELKTRPTSGSVTTFLRGIADDRMRRDCRTVSKIMKQATGSAPKMWGASLVGFGRYHYVYASGREGDWFLTGFSPRRQALTIYIMPGFSRYGTILRRLGKHKTGKCCLYVKRLSDVSLKALTELIRKSITRMKQADRRAAR